MLNNMLYKEVQDGSVVLKVYYDNDAENPREWDNLSKMVCFHHRYSLGDKHNYRVFDYHSWEDLKDAIEKDNDVAVILPLYMYDHSGITISTTPFSCPWDSGQIGWVYITKEDIRKEYNIKRVTKKYIEKATKILLSEVKVYDDYLRGETYGFVLEKDGEEIDSCWGFYGSDFCTNGMKEQIEKEYQPLVDAL